ncbi:hypothetical protein HYH03_018525 [Edaphochlamys debaryana]|uniref:Protein kinase domain-containing protein n=1 Tax=Edaphochlamys debaryana TaxID=47281 RepID=A0A835XFP8_9CHLO|nr:hypothetical protein HYH03_018525 [Edaphochlamys debaryana]|eukprot:KAG2482534.1 hypothetical protein HYH03_018525 [Edaphochlamys debaryana]
MAVALLQNRLEEVDKEFKKTEAELLATGERFGSNPQDAVVKFKHGRLIAALARQDAHRRHLVEQLAKVAVAEVRAAAGLGYLDVGSAAVCGGAAAGAGAGDTSAGGCPGLAATQQPPARVWGARRQEPVTRRRRTKAPGPELRRVATPLAPEPAPAAAARPPQPSPQPQPPPQPPPPPQPQPPPQPADVRAAPSRVLLVFHEGQARQGSEGFVADGTCDGVECVMKLLGPNPSGLAAHARELAAYAALEPLQGRQVPELRAWGDIRWGVRFLALRRLDGAQPLSRLPRPLPPGVAAAALAALEAVQAACPRFVHGDVRLSNFMWVGPEGAAAEEAGGAEEEEALQPQPNPDQDSVSAPEPDSQQPEPGPERAAAGSGDGGGGGGAPGSGAARLRCVLLDFGRSRLDGDASQQQREREQLRGLLAAAQQEQEEEETDSEEEETEEETESEGEEEGLGEEEV